MPSSLVLHRLCDRGQGVRPPLDATNLAPQGRNVVERGFDRLKAWRAVATRYDKPACNYRAGVILACIVLFRAATASDPSDALGHRQLCGERRATLGPCAQGEPATGPGEPVSQQP